MSSKPKKGENKTPMQNALGRIKIAYIMAFISAAITLIAAFTGFMGADAWVAFDAVIVIVLAILLILLKSRVASIILLAHYLFSSILIIIDNPGSAGLIMRIVFIAAYIGGVMGTFAYHKLKEQEKNAAAYAGAGYAGAYYGADPRFTMPATPAIRQDAPGGKVILSHTHENLEITVKRGSGVTELVVNGMVYAQETSTFDLNYEMNVYVENALIKVHRDTMGVTYIYVNGNLVRSK